MGFLLIMPFFLIRFGFLSLLNRDALKRAAYYAPPLEREKAAYGVYQVSNVAIVLYLFFLSINQTPVWLFYIGLAVYSIGLLLLLLSVVNYAAPVANGFQQNGLYRLSRNPMYVAYLIVFLGCVLLTQSWLLLILVVLFQITAHWIILAEERWCIQQYGRGYLRYMDKVRRYL